MMYVIVSERNYRMKVDERQIKESSEMSLGLIDGMQVAFRRLVDGTKTTEIVAVPVTEFNAWYDKNGNAPYVYTP